MSTSTGTSTSASTSSKPNDDDKANNVVQPSMTEYCQSLETWLSNVYMQRSCATSAYFTAYSIIFGGNNNVLTVNNNYSEFSPNRAEQPNFNQRINNIFTREFRAQQPLADTLRIAPIWKRLVAEIFDFLVLLVIKIFVTLTLIDNFQLIDMDSIELEVIQDSGSIYDIAIALTSELIVLELTHRVVVCFFEAYCLAKNGCTPGKNLLRLRVIHCEIIQESNNRLIITPGGTLSFPRALLRSFLKNFSIALFFPMCFTLLHFENNQTLYDHVAKSIVVSF